MLQPAFNTCTFPGFACSISVSDTGIVCVFVGEFHRAVTFYTMPSNSARNVFSPEAREGVQVSRRRILQPFAGRGFGLPDLTSKPGNDKVAIVVSFKLEAREGVQVSHRRNEQSFAAGGFGLPDLQDKSEKHKVTDQSIVRDFGLPDLQDKPEKGKVIITHLPPPKEMISSFFDSDYFSIISQGCGRDGCGHASLDANANHIKPNAFPIRMPSLSSRQTLGVSEGPSHFLLCRELPAGPCYSEAGRPVQ